MTSPERRDKLWIANACPKSWTELAPESDSPNGPKEAGESRRFCGACSLHVHDSAALTRAEAHELARSASAAGQRVCMRLVLDDHGAVVHKDSAPIPRPALGRVARWVAAAGAGLAAACQPTAAPPIEAPSGAGDGEAANTCTTELLGEIAAPSERVPELLGDVALTPADPQPR